MHGCESRRAGHGPAGRGSGAPGTGAGGPLGATRGTRGVNAVRTLPDPLAGPQVSTLRKRVFVLAQESARVQHVAGTRKRNGKDKRTWLSW
ncbi:hypothetical protein GCM10019017_65340 [Streptomyces showdoensis]